MENINKLMTKTKIGAGLEISKLSEAEFLTLRYFYTKVNLGKYYRVPKYVPLKDVSDFLTASNIDSNNRQTRYLIDKLIKKGLIDRFVKTIPSKGEISNKYTFKKQSYYRLSPSVIFQLSSSH